MSDYPRNPATALSAAVARIVDQLVTDVVQCVERGPCKLTDTQRVQLRVVIGMHARDAATQGRWYERQRHNLGVATTLISSRAVIREVSHPPATKAAPPATSRSDPGFGEDATTVPIAQLDLGDE